MNFKKKLLLLALLIILIYLYKVGYLSEWKKAALRGMAYLRKDVGNVLSLFVGERNAR